MSFSRQNLLLEKFPSIFWINLRDFAPKKPARKSDSLTLEGKCRTALKCAVPRCTLESSAPKKNLRCDEQQQQRESCKEGLTSCYKYSNSTSPKIHLLAVPWTTVYLWVPPVCSNSRECYTTSSTWVVEEGTALLLLQFWGTVQKSPGSMQRNQWSHSI